MSRDFCDFVVFWRMFRAILVQLIKNLKKLLQPFRNCGILYIIEAAKDRNPTGLSFM